MFIGKSQTYSKQVLYPASGPQGLGGAAAIVLYRLTRWPPFFNKR
jgi:hypothetical protein